MPVKMPSKPRLLVKTELTDSSEEESDHESETEIDIKSEDEQSAQEDADDSDDGETDADIDTNLETNSDTVNSESANQNSSDNDSMVGDEDDDEETMNAGWADSIAKILKTNKPKNKKTLVLSKAKKLSEVQKEKPKPAGFQIETADGKIIEQKIEPKAESSDEEEEPQRKKRKDIPSVRVKPNILHKDRERLLSKIATKGVVQLFNAVREQQKDISNKLDQAGSLEVRRDKVLKNVNKHSFLDNLMGDESKSIKVDKMLATKDKQEAKKEVTWSVLRDDFMMPASKLKDWDKQFDQTNEDEKETEIELESD